MNILKIRFFKDSFLLGPTPKRYTFYNNLGVLKKIYTTLDFFIIITIDPQ